MPLPAALTRHARPGHRHRSRMLRASPAEGLAGLWARFLDDRQAIRLKMLLLAACALAAGLLEGPWP